MNIGIVTGASSGMGMEFVKQLADKYRGLDQIWVIARRLDCLEELARSVKCTSGVTLVPIDMDLMDINRITDLEQILRQKKPNVRILVNCAGVGKIGGFEEQGLDDQVGMVRLNCTALTAVTRLVLPYMPSKSRIIQVASAAAFLPQPYFAVYAATKAYVYSLSKALNEELKSRKITVTAVCPGPVKTEFFEHAYPEGGMPAYKQAFLADSKKVVKQAIADCAKGRQESIYGISMKLVKGIGKFMPHKICLAVMGLAGKE